MTLEELYRIRSRISLASHEELVDLAALVADEFIGELTLRIERERGDASLAKEYQKVCGERDALRKENAQLKAALKKSAEDSQKKTREIFGRSSEKIEELLNTAYDREEVDEAESDGCDSGREPARSGKPSLSRTGGSGSRHRGKKRKGKRLEDLNRLRHETTFVIDFDALEREFGAEGYRIAFWHRTTTVEHRRPEVYAQDTWTPVISIGLQHDLLTLPGPAKLLPGSLVSPSLGAEIFYQKFCLLLPFYRIEDYFAGIGYPIARQIISGWVIRLVNEYFFLLYDFMKARLMEQPYHHCDETTLQVIHDGRSAGTKSYVWVHCTGELLTCHPIILFCYELTRGTDHLRRFYEDFKGYITCDAYVSYQVLEKERGGDIHVTGCLMHARRRFADALALIDRSGMTGEQIEALPEMKALVLLGRIFDADGALKDLSEEERLRRRREEVRPIVEEYYEYIEGINTEDPAVSDTLKDAVGYSLNQRAYLCRFLEDGNIPCDNGKAERCIRPLATARRSFLFCNSIEGATALVVMFSIVETARANGADVRCYLQYVLEVMPAYMRGTDLSFLSAMMPWSEEYREYEKKHLLGAPEPGPNEYKEKPRTPSRRKRAA